MAWNDALRGALLNNVDGFTNTYANDITREKLGLTNWTDNSDRVQKARRLAFRLTELMPNAIAHGSSGFNLRPCPWLAISRVIDKNGRLDGDVRVVVFWHENNFWIGLRRQDQAATVFQIRPEAVLNQYHRGQEVLADAEQHLDWQMIDNLGHHAVTPVNVPDVPDGPNGEILELADDTPLANLLSAMDEFVFEPGNDHWQNYLRMNGYQDGGVLTPGGYFINGNGNVKPPDNDMTARNLILYGPPGTGKTHSLVDAALALQGNPDAQEEFTAIREQKELQNPDPGRRERLRGAFNSALGEGTVVFTTFHQSYAYEDFIEGVRVNTVNGAANYFIRNGTFKRLARKALFHRVVALVEHEQQEALDAAERYSLTSDHELRRDLANQQNLSRMDSLLLDLARGQLPTRQKLADVKSAQRFVLVIDEINRGNIAKIFGELITLIEDNKRLGAEEALSATLPYSGETFTVPDNLYIVATMNTADRSLATLDVALRRRFEFIEMMPQPEFLSGVNIDGIDMEAWLRALNDRIQVLRGREFTIGHALFSELRQTNNSQKMETLARIMRRKILPLLDEYFFDDWRGMRKVLGDVNTNDEEQAPLFIEEQDGAALGMRTGTLYRWRHESLRLPRAYTKLYGGAGAQEAQAAPAG